MKQIKSATLFLGFIWLIVLVFATGCQNQSPVSSIQAPNNVQPVSLAKKPVRTATSVDEVSLYPQSASTTLNYWKKQQSYSKGGMLLPNGSQFLIPYGSLTPPPGTREGAPVTITFTIKKDMVNNELIYEFGPSGCQFDPPAEVWMKWSDLGNDGTPKLFYIENTGNYVEQQPDQIDYSGQWMMIKINHFSRYAIAFSR